VRAPSKIQVLKVKTTGKHKALGRIKVYYNRFSQLVKKREALNSYEILV
jgi:hypothetical protein